MSSTARMDRARLERFNRFWEELLQAVPDARRQAVEEAGAAVQRELNAQIGAAELADGAKGTVRTWQELRVGSKGGYAALSPGKGTAQPRVEAGGRKQPVVEPGGAGRSHAGLSRRICQGPAIL